MVIWAALQDFNSFMPCGASPNAFCDFLQALESILQVTILIQIIWRFPGAAADSSSSTPSPFIVHLMKAFLNIALVIQLVLSTATFCVWLTLIECISELSALTYMLSLVLSYSMLFMGAISDR